MDDPIARNLRITLGYHELMLGMADLMGSKNVSWPAFATWASRSAGAYIRGEYVRNLVQAYLEKLGIFRTGLHLSHLLMTAIHNREPLNESIIAPVITRVSQQITENVAWGNHLVFADVAPIYAGLCDEFHGAMTYDQRAIDRFCSRFDPGEVTDGGEELLRLASENYYKARFERNGKKQAELVLLANNQIGLHEQTRLQDAILNSLNAPIADLITDAAKDRARELTHKTLQRPVTGVIDRVMRSFSKRLQREWQSLATTLFMSLSLPDGDLKVRRDLPPRCEHRMFPEELSTLENPELIAILSELDRTPDTVKGSAAHNWAELGDRMNYVVDFFRVRQQDQRLYAPPFTEEQIALIRENQVPEGDI